MKLLLDENLPVVLVREFAPEFEVTTVRRMGWSGKLNGDLLRAMVAADIRFLITADRGLPHQLPLERFGVHLILLRVVQNKLSMLLPLVPQVKSYLQEGRFETVRTFGTR
jgi:predicted nuclease of predicted toxin-antitoxin system